MRSPARATGRWRGGVPLVVFLAVLIVSVSATRVDPAGAYPAVPPPALLLSEIMVNPSGDDAGREWIELYNAGAEPVDLRHVVFEVVGLGVLVVGEGALGRVAEPGEYVLLGAPLPVWSASGLAETTSVSVDVPIYGDVLLPNDQGRLRLLWQGVVLDEVSWGAPDWVVPAGAALNREPTWDVAGGDPRGGTWCAARLVFGGADGDRGTPGAPNTWCDDDGDGFAEDEGDCDDAAIDVSPDAVEVCNGRDDDCDGQTDDVAPPATVACLSEGVCANVVPVCRGVAGWECPYPTSYEVVETLCDGADNDCDGETDEGLRNACGKCGALPEDICDGVDNDCDGETDEDALAEPLMGAPECRGPGVCAGAAPRCAGAAGWICTWPPAWEEGEETSCDGRDNDCDGETDEPFGVGAPCTVGVGVCRATGVRVCAEDETHAVCDATPGPPGEERCGDGLDNDCDGLTDEDFDLGAECVVGVGVCRTRGKLVCTADGLGTFCSAAEPLPGVEICGNRRDDDCDGVVDEEDCVPDDATAPPLAPTGCAAARQGPPAPFWPAAALFAGALGLAVTALRRRS